MDWKNCRICMSRTTKETLTADPDNQTVKNQLQFVAPEIVNFSTHFKATKLQIYFQDWSEPLFICSQCRTSLQTAYNFKKLCLDNHNHLQPFIDHNSFDKTDLEDGDIKSENSDCDKVCNTKAQLETHLKQSHKSFQCKNCEATFTSKTELKSHSKTEHPNQAKLLKFQCQNCSKPFSLLKDILHHCTTEHSMLQKDIKPYHCNECQKRFASCSLLIQHKKYHTGVRSFICTICGKSFVTRRDLSGHEKLHNNQRNYSCTVCNKTFNTSQNLKTHTYVVHTDSSQWKYSCPICSKRFAMKANWNEHIKRHKGSKEYECYVCKKLFVSNHEMKKHVKLHSNIATLKCSQCDKLYRDKRCLDQHLYKIHGVGECKQVLRVKKFVCHICPSQFYDNSKLQRHIRTHTGKKPFSCSECDKRFIDKSYLSQHLKSVHKSFEIFSTKDFSKYL